MVKGNKKCKILNKLEMYLNEVLANPRSPRSDFKILDNALENVYTVSKDANENIREMYNDAISTKKFKDLKVLISAWLSNRVSKETVLATIIIADEYNDENLKIKALKFIHNNIDLVECTQWEELHKYNGTKDEVYRALLFSLLRHNEELALKVNAINTDLIKTDQYEFPIKSVFEEDEALVKQTFIEEQSNEQLLDEGSMTEETLIGGTLIEEPPIDESFIVELSIEESFIGELSIEEYFIEEPPIEESFIEEPPIDESLFGELSIETPSIEESFMVELSIEEPPIEESFIEDPLIDESFIGELSIETPSIEESLIEEPPIEESFLVELSIEEPSIEESPTEESLIEEPPIEEFLNEMLSTEEPLIEKQSMKQEVTDDLPSTSSKGLTNSVTTAEMSQIEEVESPVNMVNIGDLNHSDGSGFQSYVAKELSEDELNQKTVKPPTSGDENNSIENLFTSVHSHFVPIKMARHLYVKKIDVNSIEKHATTDTIEIAVAISPPPISSNFSMKLPASQGNSSQSLCSNFTEHLINNCSHNLMTACKLCSGNTETEMKKEENENNVLVQVDKDLPIEMFINSKTNKINDQNDISGWVEHSAYLTKEKKLAKQKFDDLEAKVALTKDKWNEGLPDILPEQDDSDFFNAKLDKAFNDLITIKSNYPARRMPVELNQDVVYNSFQDLKQKAERRFEMRYKGIHIPDNYVFDAIPITSNEKFNTPTGAKTGNASNSKFFPQNKNNTKFFKSNQNTFNQRCNHYTGYYPY